MDNLVTTAQYVPDNKYVVSKSPLYTTNLEGCVAIGLGAGTTLGLWHCHAADIIKNTAHLGLQEFLLELEKQSHLSRRFMVGYVVGGDYDRYDGAKRIAYYRHNNLMCEMVRRQGVNVKERKHPGALIERSLKSALIYHESDELHLRTLLHRNVITNPATALARLIETH
ncbi:hypothetical protein HYV86_04850 [Candidatus Woesearchaeota archaeon]|nr:hypothetical protein [Candidatus Woesearchaeota archaeon]